MKGEEAQETPKDETAPSGYTGAQATEKEKDMLANEFVTLLSLPIFPMDINKILQHWINHHGEG